MGKATVAWSDDPSTPIGLCIRDRKIVFVDVGFADQRFNLSFKAGEISQMFVPVFETFRDEFRASALREGKAGGIKGLSEEEDSTKLIGVFRCVNKFRPPGSRSGDPFHEEDQPPAATFASLFGKYAVEAHTFNTVVKPALKRFIVRRRTQLQAMGHFRAPAAVSALSSI